MRTTKLLPATIAAFALVLGLAACGGSSSPSSDKPTTTKAESGGSGGKSTTTEAGDSGKATTTEADSSTTVVATGGGDFCENLAEYINDSSSSEYDATDPESYKKLIEESTKKGKELFEQAPDELDDSVEVLLDAQDQLAAELAKVDYDITKIDPSSLDVMSTPEIQKAGEELDAYVTDTCGIDIPQVTAATIPDMTVPDMSTPN
ncbi:MAG: hypothetical protein JWO77_3562 [Ilumatobacteraceae bacterium]|nr:hypothetical protein [Ilumatobacteraceae bacterium]